MDVKLVRACKSIYANEIRERVDTKRNPYWRIRKNRKALSCDGPTLVEMPVHDEGGRRRRGT
jgi:hypothetical protein